MRVPKKGSVQWHDLYPQCTKDEQWSEVKIGVIHVGPAHARRWSTLYLRLNLAEASDANPEIVEHVIQFVTSVISEGVAGIDGVEGVASDDKDAASSVLEYMEVGDLLNVVTLIMDQQQLSDRQKFSAKDNGSVEGG